MLIGRDHEIRLQKELDNKCVCKLKVSWYIHALCGCSSHTQDTRKKIKNEAVKRNEINYLAYIDPLKLAQIVVRKTDVRAGHSRRHFAAMATSFLVVEAIPTRTYKGQ